MDYHSNKLDNYFPPIFNPLIILLLTHQDCIISTKSILPLGKTTSLYPSGSILSLVSRQTLLPLRNRWYSLHFGLVCTHITHKSLASCRPKFLLGYSNLFKPLLLFACFACCDFLAAIPCLLVLDIRNINKKISISIIK